MYKMQEGERQTDSNIFKQTDKQTDKNRDKK